MQHGRSQQPPARGTTIVQADAREWLPTLPAESVDLVVTDPPYESLEKHRSIGTTTRLKGQWFETIPNGELPGILAELYRVLRKDRHCYIFADWETALVVAPAAEAAGFKVWKPIVWDKVKLGMGYHYRSRYELIMFLEKGKRRLADLSVANVLAVPRVHGGYPTEKPVALLEVLIRQSAPGEIDDDDQLALGLPSERPVVLDPFCGSASTGVAAERCGCRFLGCDVVAVDGS